MCSCKEFLAWRRFLPPLRFQQASVSAGWWQGEKCLDGWIEGGMDGGMDGSSPRQRLHQLLCQFGAEESDALVTFAALPPLADGKTLAD